MVHRIPTVALYHMPEVDLPGYLILASVRHVVRLGELDGSVLAELTRV